MGIWFLILVHALAEAQRPIIQTVDLDVQVDTSFRGIGISTYIVGNNVTYWVSGTYTTITGAPLSTAIPLPTIQGDIQLIASIPKPVIGVGNAKIGLKADPLNQNFMFGVNSNTLNAWDVSIGQFVTSTTLKYPINAMYTFSNRDQTIVVAVPCDGSNIYFTFFGFDSSVSAFSQLGKTMSFPFGSLISGSQFDIYNGTAYLYVWGITFNVYSFVIGSLNVLPGSPVTPSQISKAFNISSFSPVYFLPVHEKNAGIVCDSVHGILVFDLNYVLQDSFVTPLWYSSDPLNYGGAILSCTSDDYHTLYVATPTSQLTYGTSFSYENHFGLELINIFSYQNSGNEKMTAVSGFTSNMASQTLSFLVNTTATTANGKPVSTLSFRVLNNNSGVISYGFMLYDQWLCGMLTQSNCTSLAMPALGIAYSGPGGFIFVLDTFSTLYFFGCYSEVSLKMYSGSLESYIFNGSLTVSNTLFYSNKTDIPLRITAWNPASTTIYTTRNRIPSEGFEAPANITLSLNSQNSLTAEVYLPLSNYFSGQNILYNVTLAPGSPEYVNVTTPPVLSRNASFAFPSKSPRIMKLLQFNGLMVIAVLSNNQVVLFDSYTQDLTPLGEVSPHNPEYQIMQFVCVIQQYSDISMLVVESQVTDGMGGYKIAWDLFDISDPSNAEYETSIHFQSDGLFGQLEGTNTILFSLRSESITVAAATRNGIFELMPITADSLGIPAFNPVKICTEVGVPQLYVYDENLSLLIITPASDYMSYTYTNRMLTLAYNPSAIRLFSYNGLLYILDPFNDTMPLISYSEYDFSVVTVFPNFADATYVSVQVSYNYLTVLSVFQGIQTVLVFNLKAVSLIRNLVAMLPVPTGSSFYFVSTVYDTGTIVHYDGETLVRWGFGQTSADWKPSSTLMNFFDSEYTVWSKVTFTFSNLINQPYYNVTVLITATSGITQETNSTSVNIWLLNQGAFITTNSSYNSSSQLITPGRLNVTDTWQFPVPEGYFIGADIEYAFVLNGNQGALILSQSVCLPWLSFVCIESKQYKNWNYLDIFGVLDFDASPDYLYYTSFDSIARVSLQPGQNITTYDISKMANVGLSFCYLIQVLSGGIVVAVCEGEYGLYPLEQLLIVFNASSPNNSYQLNIGVRIYAMKAIYDSGIKIFLSDYARVLVYILTGSQLTLSSIISSGSLNLDYPISPTSVEYISNSYILLADSDSGNLFLLQNVSNSSPSYTYQISQTLSGFPSYNSTNGIASIRLGPNNTVFALSEGTILYQYSLLYSNGVLSLS